MQGNRCLVKWHAMMQEREAMPLWLSGVTTNHMDALALDHALRIESTEQSGGIMGRDRVPHNYHMCGGETPATCRTTGPAETALVV